MRNRGTSAGRKTKRELKSQADSCDKQDSPNNAVPPPCEPWTPSAYTAFKALTSARICASIWNNIHDCDETYNYWEPTHYLMFGRGMQTWEYSPVYALRSYTYLLLHALPGWLYNVLLQSNQLLVFYFMRCLLGFLCAACEMYFYRGVCREFGANVGRIMLGFLIFSAGMFVASSAFLPSSFAMYMFMLSMGAWFQQSYTYAIFTTALSAFLGWPFAGVLGVPIAIDLLFRRKNKASLFFKWCAISAAVILVPMVQIDSHMYSRLVVAPVNLVLYNMFSGAAGPSLYGTEPWHFYLANGFLNFNAIFPAALCSALFVALTKLLINAQKRSSVCLPYTLSLMPIYIWFSVFFPQPHKEERFLYPVYPYICLCGAISVDCVQKLWYRFVVPHKTVHYLQRTNWIAVLAVLVSSLVSVSRILALYKGYHGTFDIYMELNRVSHEELHVAERQINLCLGKEWYRFPSSFFLPSDNWRLQFIKSEFRGQLPQPYSELRNGTMVVPKHMNDLNKEEPSRYLDVSMCHFLIDIESDASSEREPNYAAQTDRWKVIYVTHYLNHSKSHPLLRAFYVPFLSELYCSFSPYNLMVAVKWRDKLFKYK